MRKYWTLSVHTSVDLSPILQITATEGGHASEATTTTDLQDSHHQSLEVTMKIELYIHTGQMHKLTIIITQIDSDIKRDHLINPGMMTETGVTHITPQNQYSQNNHPYNNSNAHHLAPDMSVVNTSELIGSLQSQIIGLHFQPLQQAMLISIHTFDGAKKNWIHNMGPEHRKYH